MVNIKSFNKQCQCIYKSERYSVRDNGSIFRHSKPNKRKRPLDEKWTFGNPCKQKGYMNFSSETVHRIVATAFHGKQPSKKHIVDHIDTNKKNNRSENLRWITRLDNILLNPITLSRIVLKYGSIDNFLENPSKPIDGELEQNFEWMRTVTKEESDNTRRNLENWVKEGKIPKGGHLGEWVHTKLNPYNSKTNTKSLNKPKNPNTPKIIGENPIQSYYDNLNKGDILFCQDDEIHFVLEKEMTNSQQMKVTAIQDLSPSHIAFYWYEIIYNGRFYEHIRRDVFYRESTEEYRNILELFSKAVQQKDDYSNEDFQIQSITPNAIQKNWKTQSEFPLCPTKLLDNPIKEYKEKLKNGSIFSKNQYGESYVEELELSNDKDEIIVITKGDNVKPYALAKVYIENNKFIHESLGTFFTLVGTQKRFSLVLGLEWTGEDSIDDYS
ncbi:HNH endonuclease signature motif containing protein [Formosa sp. A9]|uniref:HNH endonuclease signature motif containing protein n=1 Tax=Formosa sp. A9 TaxID=3442641 RepID=UPI003EC0487C